MQKRRRTASGPLIRLAFADFRSLQDQAEQLFPGGHHNLSKPQRVRLHSLQIGGQPVGEGSLVEITGFLAMRPGEPHANRSGETVNCRLTGTGNNDIHITVTPAQDQSEWQGVVVEMVPQQRPVEWSEPRLRNVQQNRRMVRVRGILFFDNHHTVNDDEAHNISNQPKRFSLWEIHPVTKFDVCTLSSCQPDGPGWKPLED